jgi:hypothetical protein
MTDSPWPAGPPPDPAQPAIARYAAPKRPSGLLILIVALLLVVAVAVVLTTWNSDDPAPTASPAAATSAAPQRQGGSVIAQGGVEGYWRVTRTQWGRDSVTVQVQIEVDSGLLSCQFYAFNDAADIDLRPRAGRYDALDGVVFASAGQTINGSLTFEIAPTNLTIIMSDGATQLSAIRVEP